MLVIQLTELLENTVGIRADKDQIGYHRISAKLPQ